MLPGTNYTFDERNGLSCNGERIADFNASIIKKKSVIRPEETQAQTSYLVQVTYTDGRKPVSKWVKNLKHIDYFELFGINDSLMKPSDKALLLNKMLDEAIRLPDDTIVKVPPGLHMVYDRPVYAMGEHIILGNHAESMPRLETSIKQTLRQANLNPALDLQDAIKGYVYLLPGVTEPLFFFSLFAAIKPFVEQLQLHCGFLLALIAPSGQLKTTLTRLYCLWLTPPYMQEIPISAGGRTIQMLDLINTMTGQNILVDDLRKSNNANDRKKQEDRLDKFSRHVNSCTGCANVILTGETMEDMGIFSCLDRIFQLNMPVMNAKQVRQLQMKVSALENNLIPEIALKFVPVLMAHYDEVLKDIQAFYDKNCLSANGTLNYATRVRRHAMFIRLTAFLFGKYFYTPTFGSADYENALDAALDSQVKQQEEKLMEIRFWESQHDFIADFYQIINGGRYIQASKSIEEYLSSDNAYWHKGEKVYITSAGLKKAFFSFYGRYIPVNEIVKQFHSEGILEEEASSKGYQKNVGGRKSYVINMPLLISYLIRHNYQVSEEMQKRFLRQF